MQPDAVQNSLESLNQARPLLSTWRLRDHEGGWQNLTHLAQAIGQDGLRELSFPLFRLLPRSPDPDMALNNLERFLTQPAGAQQLPALLEGRARTLEILVQLLGTSQFFSDLLFANPDYLGMLRVPLRRSPSQKELQDQLQADIAAAYEDSAVLRAFRRFRQRQVLRIGTNDIIRDRPLEEITRDISRVADAALEVALSTALRHVGNRFGEAYTNGGEPARCVILAFGKHGGEELNYSSDIDLMFLYDEEGSTRGRRITSIDNSEFFGRVLTEVVRLLSAHTDRGQAYRVDLRLRPEGQRGPLARSLASTLSYYDAMGRTWERQALIKVRPAAGDERLGEQFLHAIEPFVYRKYLSFSEINEIKAIKRRIERKSDEKRRQGDRETERQGDRETGRQGDRETGRQGDKETRRQGDKETDVVESTLAAEIPGMDVKTGHGGIRDIEFTIQFLQLLNGGDLPELRQRNTLLAMQALERAGCLTDQEYHLLDDAYRFLRKTEHRLQLLFDLQTHRLPTGEDELRKLALRMGYADHSDKETRRQGDKEQGEAAPLTTHHSPLTTHHSPLPTALGGFLHDYAEKTDRNHKILNHMMHQTFASEHAEAEPESDLILDLHPDPETVRTVLERYGFRDVHGAYLNLTQLAQESVRFLSERRCRHFLANIAHRLLQALAETPDPDMALVNLEKVTASLGAKAVLWELFSFSPPSLKLYVELCAWSQFLSEILINNPGMIDDLLDSLVLNQPSTPAELCAELAELCRGAADPEPILHSFRDKELLRIGVRDILGMDTIQETTSSLSHLAETILVQIATMQYQPLVRRFGLPYLDPAAQAGRQGDKETGRQGDKETRRQGDKESEGQASGPGGSSPSIDGVSRYVILGLGKLGGQELSYHSDLDLIIVYEGDGRTGPPPEATRFDRFELTDNFHFFTELGQRIIKVTSVLGPMGRLYQVDMRLRPTGKSGSLVIPLAEFRRYYEEGGAQLWERQALTRARLVLGDTEFGKEVMAVVEHGAYGLPWRPELAVEIREMRERLEASRSDRDFKRGFGGIVDVEFLVQLFQLKYGRERPELRTTSTWSALEALRNVGLLNESEHAILRSGYDFLRLVESRLRIVHNRSLDELPETPEDLEKLARRLGFENSEAGNPGSQFLSELERHTTRIRELFLQLVEREREITG